MPEIDSFVQASKDAPEKPPVNLKMSWDMAEWLMGMMQNKLSPVEDQSSTNNRAKIFQALRSIGVKVV